MPKESHEGFATSGELRRHERDDLEHVSGEIVERDSDYDSWVEPEDSLQPLDDAPEPSTEDRSHASDEESAEKSSEPSRQSEEESSDTVVIEGDLIVEGDVVVAGREESANASDHEEGFPTEAES